MQAFEYARPSTKQAAIALLGSQWNEAAILAGGTDLLALMKDSVMAPKRVVSIAGIAELRGITGTPAGVRIGALATIEELMTHATIRQQYRALSQAAAGITSPQIRTMGTVGGDLCQRPRCWYFRAGFGLLAKGEYGKSLVPEGENRYHAIFGTEGGAYFVSASSLGPALVALGARVHLFGPKGARELPVSEFFAIPRSEAQRENVLQPNELLTHISIPAAAGMRSATYEVRQKEALDWPLATASVTLKLSGGSVKEAHIVLGHVAPIPWHATEAEKTLAGRLITEATAAAAGEAAVRGARPLSHNKYKIQLAKVAVKRALLAAAKGGA